MTSQAKKYDVVGIGRSFVDIIAPVSYEFMEKFELPVELGSFPPAEIFYEVQKNIKPDTRAPGGNISNTLAGMSAMGAKTGFFSKTGSDDTGHYFKKDLTDRAIDDLCDNPVKSGQISGTCLVLLTPGGERSFVLHIGCTDDYHERDFENFDFNEAKMFLIDANQLSNASDTSNVDAIAKGILKAAQTDCRIIVSMSVVRSWEGRESYLKDVLLPHADIITGNETENDVLFKYVGNLADTDKLIITTKGEHGVTARRGTHEIHAPAIKPPVFASSLGAGDQFLAGFLRAEALDMPLEECLKIGTRCATEILQDTEARPALGTDWGHLVRR